MLRRLAICSAFATWCFADTWVEYAEGDTAYFSRLDPFRTVVVPVAILEIVLILGMLAVWEFCRERRLTQTPALHYLFLFSCLAPLGIASVAALRIAPTHVETAVRLPWFWPAVLLVSSIPAGWACLRPLRASRLLRNTLFYSCPVLLFTLLQAARGTLHYPHAAYADGAPGVAIPASHPDTRVVWIIFDELSQTIAFANRPPNLALPNLDRLRPESFYATAAAPPADSTEISLPGLVLGEPVVGASPQGPADLELWLASRAGPVAWSALPNLFDRARELGFPTALVGWFHPYGRLLNRSLTQCYWTAGWLPPGAEEPSEPQPLARALWNRVLLQFAALPLIGHLPVLFPGRYHRQQKIERFRYLDARAREVVSNRALGLVLLHLPVPHPPDIYDRTRAAFSAGNRASYLDSVALADVEWGRLRQAMEDAGTWDRTAVLLSADHGWRTAMWRGKAEWTPEDEANSRQNTAGVPFLVKLPGQTSGMVYTREFNTIVTGSLITAILKGRIADPPAVAAFLDAAAPGRTR